MLAHFLLALWLPAACTDPGEFVQIAADMSADADMSGDADMDTPLPLERSCTIALDCEADASFHVTVLRCTSLGKQCEYACTEGWRELPPSANTPFQAVGCPCITAAHPCHTNSSCAQLNLPAWCDMSDAADMGAGDMGGEEMGL